MSCIDLASVSHPEWDEIFADLSDLMDPTAGEFGPELLDSTEFSEQFAHVEAILPKMKRKLKQGSAIRRCLADSLFVSADIEPFIVVANYQAYIKVFERAVHLGFLPDACTMEGPTNTHKWVVLQATPVKKSARLGVNGPQVTFIPSPLTHDHPSLDTTHSSPYVPPMKTTTTTKTATRTMPTPLPAHQWTGIADGKPFDEKTPIQQKEDVATLMNQFLGLSHGSGLPSSTNPGVHVSRPSLPTLSSSNVLPPLLAPPGDVNTLFVPTSQPIYKLRDYLPQGRINEDELAIKVSSDGLVVQQSNNSKIVTALDWHAAFRNFAVLLASSPYEADTFNWTDIQVYQNRVAAYFAVYTTSSVIAYDIAFRKWRRAYNLKWSATNSYINDTHLVMRPLQIPNTSTKKSTKCFDFDKGKCYRQACSYIHRCGKCNTTWPASANGCACTNGVFPNNYQPPPGVVIGQ